MEAQNTPLTKQLSRSPAVSPDESKVTVEEAYPWNEEEGRDSSATEIYISYLIDKVLSKLGNVSKLPIVNGSPVLLDPCTQDMLDSIDNALREASMPVPRMFVENNKLLLEEYPISGNHERISRSFDGSVAVYNNGLSGIHNAPISLQGSADHMLQYGTVQPDSQYEVETVSPRNCPNMVVEVATGQRLEALHHKCRRYLNETDNVLVVVGVKVFLNEDAPNTHMVAFVYLRHPDGAPVVAPVTAIAFGSLVLPAVLRDEVLHVTRVADVTGYVEGIDPLVPCNQRNIPVYQLRIDHRLLLAVDRAGNVIAPEHEHAPDLFIDLFLMQRSTR